MKRHRHTPEQVVRKLAEGERMSTTASSISVTVRLTGNPGRALISAKGERRSAPDGDGSITQLAWPVRHGVSSNRAVRDGAYSAPEHIPRRARVEVNEREGGV